LERKIRADVVLRALSTELSQRLDLGGSLWFDKKNKPGAFGPCPTSLIDEISSLVQIVLVGVGDCGSCTSYSIADSLQLEERGVRCIMISTRSLHDVGQRVCPRNGKG
jgi:hypothetical protein